MSRGVEPLTQLGQVRRGQCSLCPTFGDRTWTHVPPRCGGNGDMAAQLCKTTDDMGTIRFVRGRSRAGGSRFYSQCPSCNGLVGRYDSEWPAWVEEIVAWLDHANRQVPEQGLPVILTNRRPGALVRSVLAGMFALTPTLREGWPQIAEAVRAGRPVEAPHDLRLLMHLYSGPHRFVASGMGKARLSMVLPSGHSFDSTSGEIAWPPLHFVLVHSDALSRWPEAMDITGWLNDDWQHVRDVNLLLKLVTVDQLFSLSLGQSASA